METSSPVRAGFFHRPYLLLTLTVLFWSGNVVLGRAVRAEVPPVALAFCRWTGATLLVSWAALPHVRREFSVILDHWRILLVYSAVGIAIFNTLLYLGLQTTTAVNGALIQSAMPVLIVFFSFFLYGERLTPGQSAGVLISLAGAVWLVSRGDPAIFLTMDFRPGDLLVFVAVICYAAYSALLRLRPPLHPLSFLWITFVAGSMLLLPFFLWEQASGRTLTATPTTLLAVGYVSVFPSILSYLFFNRGVELVGPNRAGLFIHLIPVFGTLLAILLLGEAFHIFQAAGALLILAGIVMVNRFRRR
jgi:drug/metabolite transporter (DMT)-like permease